MRSAVEESLGIGWTAVARGDWEPVARTAAGCFHMEQSSSGLGPVRGAGRWARSGKETNSCQREHYVAKMMTKRRF